MFRVFPPSLFLLQQKLYESFSKKPYEVYFKQFLSFHLTHVWTGLWVLIHCVHHLISKAMIYVHVCQIEQHT